MSEVVSIYAYDNSATLSDGHYRVLATSPHAKKLQTITLDKEKISDEMRAEI